LQFLAAYYYREWKKVCQANLAACLLGCLILSLFGVNIPETAKRSRKPELPVKAEQ
jgi:hypothetical protein